LIIGGGGLVITGWRGGGPRPTEIGGVIHSQVWRAEREQVATDCDGRFLRVVGYSTAELAELTIADVTHPDDRVREAQRLSIYFSSGASYESDKLLRPKGWKCLLGPCQSSHDNGADGQRGYSIGARVGMDERGNWGNNHAFTPPRRQAVLDHGGLLVASLAGFAWVYGSTHY
jgi:PAS fold